MRDWEPAGNQFGDSELPVSRPVPGAGAGSGKWGAERAATRHMPVEDPSSASKGAAGATADRPRLGMMDEDTQGPRCEQLAHHQGPPLPPAPARSPESATRATAQ